MEQLWLGSVFSQTGKRESSLANFCSGYAGSFVDAADLSSDTGLLRGNVRFLDRPG
jgi:hypothetical protein